MSDPLHDSAAFVEHVHPVGEWLAHRSVRLGFNIVAYRETPHLARAHLAIGERRFDGIVVTNYLHRPLLPRLVESLAPGGVLIYETFAKGNEKLGRPRNPEFLLNPAELLDAFAPRLTIMAYEHAIEEEPTPAVRQRICAVNAPEPVGNR